jgi:5-carboxymethyl-2-hydroxymuconate isomerase
MLWMIRAGNDRASVKKGCELLLKILDAILAQPEEEKYVLLV